MPFSFTPGQDQTAVAAPAAAPAPTLNNGVPALNVPVAPTISLTPVTEALSPFAYKNRNKSKFGVYFQFGVFLIFIISAVVSIGLFAYQGSINLQISNRKADLEKLQAGFKKPKDLDDIIRLSSRLTLINKIINERVSVRTAFRIIEESISSPVTYNKFALAKSRKDQTYDLTFAGETNSYAALYQQIEILNSNEFHKVFPKISITGIGPLDKRGIASFNVGASVAIAGINPDDNFTVIGGFASSTKKVDLGTTTSQVGMNQGTTTPSGVTP